MAKCRLCGGNSAKKLSIIEKEGTNTGNFGGIGGGSGGVALGGGKTRNKSKLAEHASYKEEDSIVETMVLWVCCGVVLFFGLLLEQWGLGISLGFGGLFIFHVLKAFGVLDKDGTAEQEQQRRNWERTWMCTDCGHRWIQ